MHTGHARNAQAGRAVADGRRAHGAHVVTARRAVRWGRGGCMVSRRGGGVCVVKGDAGACEAGPWRGATAGCDAVAQAWCGAGLAAVPTAARVRWGADRVCGSGGDYTRTLRGGACGVNRGTCGRRAVFVSGRRRRARCWRAEVERGAGGRGCDDATASWRASWRRRAGMVGVGARRQCAAIGGE
jgi:hypothetical protein